MQSGLSSQISGFTHADWKQTPREQSSVDSHETRASQALSTQSNPTRHSSTPSQLFGFAQRPVLSSQLPRSQVMSSQDVGTFSSSLHPIPTNKKKTTQRRAKTLKRTTSIQTLHLRAVSRPNQQIHFAQRRATMAKIARNFKMGLVLVTESERQRGRGR